MQLITFAGTYEFIKEATGGNEAGNHFASTGALPDFWKVDRLAEHGLLLQHLLVLLQLLLRTH